MIVVSELDICFGHIKHHFLATDWYVIQTDLVSDKEVRIAQGVPKVFANKFSITFVQVGVPGSALQYKYPLLVNDEVMLRYTCNEEEMLAENAVSGFPVCPTSNSQ